MFRYDIFNITNFADMINATPENVSFGNPDDNWDPKILVSTHQGMIIKRDNPDQYGNVFYADRGPREKKFSLNLTLEQIINDLHIYAFEFSKYYDSYVVYVNADKYVVK